MKRITAIAGLAVSFAAGVASLDAYQDYKKAADNDYCTQLKDGQLVATKDGKNFRYLEEIRNTTPENRDAGFWHLDKAKGECKMRGVWFESERFKSGGLPDGAKIQPRVEMR